MAFCLGQIDPFQIVVPLDVACGFVLQFMQLGARMVLGV